MLCQQCVCQGAVSRVCMSRTTHPPTHVIMHTHTHTDADADAETEAATDTHTENNRDMNATTHIHKTTHIRVQTNKINRRKNPHTHKSTHKYTYSYKHNTPTRRHIYTYTHTHKYTYQLVFTHAHTLSLSLIQNRKHTRTHARVHTHTKTHAHTTPSRRAGRRPQRTWTCGQQLQTTCPHRSSRSDCGLASCSPHGIPTASRPEHGPNVINCGGLRCCQTFDARAGTCEAANRRLTSDCNRGGRLQPAVSATETAEETATKFATEPSHRLPSGGQTRGQFAVPWSWPAYTQMYIYI